MRVFRVKNCRETVKSQSLPRGIQVSRRALWQGKNWSIPGSCKRSTTTTQTARKVNLQRESQAPSNFTVDVERCWENRQNHVHHSLSLARQGHFEKRVPTVEVDTLKKLSHGNFSFAEVFIALKIPANKTRKLRQKTSVKTLPKLSPQTPPLQRKTSPKTSLCRNPLLIKTCCEIVGSQSSPRGIQMSRRHSCTRVRGPLSRYTCRSRFPQNPGVFQVLQRYRATPPLKSPVAPVTLQKSVAAASEKVSRYNQETLNAPFLNGLFASGFSRGKAAP